MDDAIRAMLDYPGPVIFDCRVDKEENCLPMIPSGAAHFEMILPDSATAEVTEAGRMMV